MANGQTAYLKLTCNLTMTLPFLLVFVLLETFFFLDIDLWNAVPFGNRCTSGALPLH